MSVGNRDSETRGTSLVRRFSVMVIGFDLLIIVPGTGAWLSSFEVPSWGPIAGVCAVLVVLKLASWYLHLRSILRPVAQWFAVEGQDAAALSSAATALHRFPIHSAVVSTLGWVGYVSVPPLLGYLAFPELLTVGRSDLIPVLLTLGGVIPATLALAYSLAQTSAEPVQIELDEAFERRGLELPRRPSSVVRRLGMLTIAIALAPWMTMSTLAWKADMKRQRETATVEAREWVSTRAAMLDRGARALDPDPSTTVVATLPEVLADATPHDSGAVVAIDIRREQIHAAAPLSDGRWLLLQAPVGSEFPVSFLLMTIAIAIWALWIVRTFAGTITTPIRRLRETIHEVVATGAISTVGKIPTARDDELGDLTRDFNELLGRLRHVATMANTLASGQLDIDVAGQGEFTDALRRMVMTLHDIVAQLREAAVGVASTAGEIHAASREQELAAERQAASIVAISGALDSLARAAVDISSAVGNVLDNAESTLATTGQMTAKISELDARSRDVGELLAVIREVGDRSDLLALNGSLEATRAGEAGRGFALVASEMRRLAERVTGTVDDVRELVHDITSASASTVVATARSRSLAEDTATAARAIVQAAHQQRADTEHASAGAREFAGIVAQTSAATTQTRTAAAKLELQAVQLERLVRRFELRDPNTPR
jgi:methyl-accepting chemotaxis protein